MPAASPEHKGPNSLLKPRRLSFLDSSQGLSYKGSKSKMTRYGVNFYFSQIHGVPPSSIRRYRIVVSSGDRSSTTSWKSSSSKHEFRIDETSDRMELLMSSELTFILQRRNLVGKPLLVGDTTKFSVSELVNKQEAHGTDPLILELNPKGELPPLLLKLSVRLFTGRNERPDIPDGESRAQVIYEQYPSAISDTLMALGEFVLALSDPPKIVLYHILCEMVDQMGKYLLEHPRMVFSYDCEDSAWLFLRETTKCLRGYKAPSGGATQSPGQLAYLANRILRGFWLLFQLHVPGKADRDSLYMNFVKQSLRQIGDSFTLKPNPPAAKHVPASTQYPALLRLKGVNMSPPHLQPQEIEPLFHTTLFKDISRWIVDHEPVHQVFWLHGKLESGMASNQLIAALMETSKLCNFPSAYYSFAQSAMELQADQYQIQSVFESMIYQLSLCNHHLACSFHATMMRSSEAVHSDLGFQTILHTLLSLNLSDQADSFPVLLVIDDLEPSNAELPSLEYTRLLQVLYTASVATRTITPATSPASPGSSFGPDDSTTDILGIHHNSLPLPPFLRIVVLSRSVGNNSSLIDEFAHRRLYDSTTHVFPNEKTRERVPLACIPLAPIAEVNSTTSDV